MNYQHHYHAGHAVDVFKHIVLIGLMTALQKKATPCVYLETHAGLGQYDLQAIPSQRTAEYTTGIAKLWLKRRQAWPALVKMYLKLVREINADQQLRYYPGSPVLMRQLLRSQDEMILNEMQPDICAMLKKQFVYDKQVHVHLADGYQQLHALLPPKLKRGLVFIDPAYETDELSQLPQILQKAYQKWPQGVFALWYPIKDRTRIENFYTQLKKQNLPKLMLVELCHLADDIPQRLNGSGIAIINSPWQFDVTLQEALSEVLNVLRVDTQGFFKIL